MGVQGLRPSWTTLGLLAYFALVLGGYLYFNLPLMVLGLVVTIGIALAGWRRILNRNLDGARMVMLSVFTVMTLMLPFAIYKSNFAPFHYATGVFGMFAAYVLSGYGEDLRKALFGMLVLMQGIILLYLATTAQTILPLDYMVKDASSNAITLFLVLVQAVYGVVLYHQKRSVPLVTPVVTLYIAIEGYGRGSLLAALVLVLLSVAFYGFTQRSMKRRLIMVAAVGVVSALFFLRFYDLAVWYLANATKLSAGLVDYARAEMWEAYVDKLDFLSILIGADFELTVIEATYNGNPHSSLIRAHHFFGLPYLVLILFLCVAIPLSTRGAGARLLNTVFYLVILMRIVSEPSLFPTPLDLFFYLGLFTMMSSPPAVPSRGPGATPVPQVPFGASHA
ncbi:hypothetical protein CLV77_3140 [Brevirhabdus pacifica]|nr:hypothetical protein [Brevirhabdus pacifica]PJJ78981.1 hypothetical protein CLV77_3140 [Brevirhabdus pacifica]